MLSIVAICLPINSQEKNTMIELPKSTLLINTQHQDLPPIQLFYGDISDEVLHAVHYSSNTFTLDPTSYNMSCGSFIETSQYEAILSAVNGFRSCQDLMAITDFDHYEAHNGYGFLSLENGIGTLYIIDLSNYEVFTCELPAISDNTSSESIYHVAPNDEGYTILAYEPDTHTVNIYEIDDEHFTIKKERHLIPPALFESPKQCAIDPMGHIYFTSSNELLILSPTETRRLPLSFDPEYVFFDDDQIYVLASSDFFLYYAVFDEHFTLLKEGQANLPNKQVTLTHSFLRNGHLYTITRDDLHPNFRNYITVYDLSTKEIIYCLALKTSKDHLLLAANLP